MRGQAGGNAQNCANSGEILVTVGLDWCIARNDPMGIPASLEISENDVHVFGVAINRCQRVLFLSGQARGQDLVPGSRFSLQIQLRAS